jgi:hypothetical protein
METNVCEVVKNQVMGKEFYYCRTHKDECLSSGCQKPRCPETANKNLYLEPFRLDNEDAWVLTSGRYHISFKTDFNYFPYRVAATHPFCTDCIAVSATKDTDYWKLTGFRNNLILTPYYYDKIRKF